MNNKVYLTNTNYPLPIDSINLLNLEDYSLLNKYSSFIIDNRISRELKNKIILFFNLTTNVRTFKKDAQEKTLVSTLLYDKSTLKKEDGIQIGEDIISLKDIEIEKTARVSFELCESELLILDKSDLLQSSRLFRKVVIDVNQDYKNVYRHDSIIDNINYFLDKDIKYILVEGLNEGLVINSLLYKGYIMSSHYLTSDLQRKFYISYSDNHLKTLL